MTSIGPAVLNGAITTFLAVVLLCDSTSYPMQQFFKVFFIVVLLGLYHAMVFLPALLSFETPAIMSSTIVAGASEEQPNISDIRADVNLENISSKT